MKTYYYIILVIIVTIAVILTLDFWNDYQKLKIEHQISLQNNKALEDSVNVLADTITILTSQVQDLSDLNEELKSKNTALLIKTKILLDSLKNYGNTVAIITDTTVKVTFDGKKGIAYFSGLTIGNLKNPENSIWLLNLWFDPIDTKAILFKDIDGLWKLKTISLTEGVQVKGTSILDDNTFAALQMYKPPIPSKNFGFNVQANLKNVWAGITFRMNNYWYLNTNYCITNGQNQWSDNILIGTSFFLF